MSSTRLTTTHIHRALHELLTAAHQRADDGHPEFPLFVYHGRPACLNSELLAGFGASINQLKSLASALDAAEQDWEDVKHPLRRRFTPLAWTCLSRLHGGDTAGAWANSHRLAFGPQRHSGNAEFNRAIDRRRRPWLYDPAEVEQPKESREPHPGCTEYDVPRAARYGWI
ncbi:hypothetical protein ACIQVO_36180 [Streptomyces sp. NPDC101062]|uniref:hypothetical protein n=1 Tax=unclassified Streptomyces TaxID=2593676 RepID=UPI0037FB0FED